MKQVIMIKDLASQGLEVNEIKNKLAEQFVKKSFGMTTIYKYRDEVKFGCQTNNQKKKLGRNPDNDKDYPGTIHRYLKCTLVLYKSILFGFYTHYQEHKKHLNESIQLFDIIEKSRHYSYHNIVTGEQNWLTLKYVSDGARMFQEEPPIYENSHIGIQKIMTTIIWKPYSIYDIDFLSKNMKYNSSYFIDNVLLPLSQKKL